MTDAQRTESAGTLVRLTESIKMLERLIILFREEGILLPEPQFEEDVLGSLVNLIVPGPSNATICAEFEGEGFSLKCGMAIRAISAGVFATLMPNRQAKSRRAGVFGLSPIFDEQDRVSLVYEPGISWKRELVAGKDADHRGWLHGLGADGLEGKMTSAIGQEEMLATVRFMARKLKEALSEK